MLLHENVHNVDSALRSEEGNENGAHASSAGAAVLRKRKRLEEEKRQLVQVEYAHHCKKC